MTDDRRTFPRYPASLAAEVEAEAGPVEVAITRDFSATGFALLTRLDIVLGSPVKVTVLLDGESVVICGICVREEVLAPEERSIWRTKAVIAVDDDVSPGYAKLVVMLGDPRTA